MSLHASSLATIVLDTGPSSDRPRGGAMTDAQRRPERGDPAGVMNSPRWRFGLVSHRPVSSRGNAP
jgi:hypothetical protein